MKNAHPIWPVHPQPLDDELLSSWMVRIAEGNCFKVLGFYGQFFGRRREIWTRDIDHLAPQWLIDELAARTGVLRERIEQMTLRRYETLVFEALNPRGATRWVLPVGVFHRERRAFGQQFCARCLATDTVPYLRTRWRLGLSMVCVRHGVRLQDRCGQCGKALAVHRLNIGVKVESPAQARWSSCLRCGHACEKDLVRVPQAELAMQAHLDGVLERGYARINDSVVYAHLYFEGLAVLLRGLERAGSVPTARSSLESNTPANRAARLLPVLALLRDWPASFLKVCKQVRFPYSVFTKDQLQLPYWLHSVLRSDILLARAKLHDDEVEAIRNYAERRVPVVSSTTTSVISGRDLSRRAKCRPVGADAAETLIACIDHHIAVVQGAERWILLRDKAMITAGRCLALSLHDLAHLKASDVGEAVAPPPHWDGIRTPEHARDLLGWYGRTVRAQWPRPVLVDALFTTSSGTQLSTQAIGARFALAVQEARLTATIRDWKTWAMPTRRKAATA